MPPLTPVERRALRARAHHLQPVVLIGTHGLTPAVLREIDVALRAHELVKIRAANGERDEREAFLDRICRDLDCAPVQHLGKLLIVWRENPDLHRETPAPRRARAKLRRGSRR
jgi:RNA-binding protein